MMLVVAFILFGLVLAYVGYPLWRGDRYVMPRRTDRGKANLLAERDVAVQMLSELESDRRAGVISEEDYASLSPDYRRRTAQLLRALAGDAPEEVRGDSVEEEIRRARQALRRDPGRRRPR